MKNRDMAIAEAVRDSLKEVVWDTDSDDRNGVMIDMDEVDLAAIIASVQNADDNWRRAIDDELVCLHLGVANSDDDPKEKLSQIINWHCAAALDPAISSDAASIRRAAIEECAKVCRDEANKHWICDDGHDAAVSCEEEIRALLDKEPATEGAEK